MSSWDDLFRSFFNIPGQRDKDTRWKENRDDTELLDPPEFKDNQEDMFEERFHLRFSEPDQMFRHFEKIFRDLGMAEFPPLGRGLGQPPHKRKPITPRDRMLKPKSECPDRGCTQQPEQREPDFLPGAFHLPSIFGNLWRKPHWGGVRSQNKVDQEIDVKNECDIVDEIVSGSKKGDDDVRVTGPSSSRDGPYFRFNSMSVTKVTRPDGSVEVRTVHGKDGEQTTVTRYRGDKKDVVITSKDANGDTKTESFTNLDEGHPGEFNRKRSASDNTPSWETMILVPQFEHRDEETKSLFKTLFGFTLP